MDDIDLKILRYLTEDGRMSLAKLGRMVNLSTPAVHYRVRNLERRGVITGYSARIDPTAIGLGLCGLVALETGGPIDAVVAALEGMPEVETCWTTAGASDLMALVRAADPPGLERALLRVRELPGVERTRTTILLATRFDREPDPALARAD